ncbi:hypothetical protein DL765_001194 [Monosporascus sp. GIB2]|nr:hypothetical protein DL765_001194 [Monosporascus sp. GIB2]
MKSSFVASFVVATASGLAAARELPPDDVRGARLYDTGIMMDRLMSIKLDTWAARDALGIYNSSNYASRTLADGPVPCINGLAKVVPGDAKQTFRCSKIDFYDFKSHADLGGPLGQGSSSWGWTSDDGREFVAIGQGQGTAFAEVSKEGKLIYLGRLPQYSTTSQWRELRSYKNYMVIGSEAARHGVQIFDMKKLLTVDPARPVTFSNSKDIFHFNGLPQGSTHNIVVNEESQYAVAVGALPRNSGCRAGLLFIDLKDPSKPTSPGCASGDGYVHDAQCIVYRGPHAKYNGTEICYGYNEDTLTIYDVTDKTTTKIISRTSYEGAAYTHQGWVLDPNWQQYLILDDEYDEVEKRGPARDGYPVTYIWDISNLEKPVQTGYYKGATKSIDHNQYVHKGRAYQSNYGAGLRILDLSSIPRDPTGAGVKELGFFDIYPEDDNQSGGGSTSFVGTWSLYPYFKSGYVLVNTIERGAFIVKPTF